MSFVVTSNILYNLLFKGWFRIKGRSSRQEYVLRFSMMFILILFCKIAESIFESVQTNALFLLLSVVFLFVIVFLLFISILQVFFVTHRSLHDLNTSGWWQLITFIPFGQILIGFIFFKGTPGPNKYGDHQNIKDSELVGAIHLLNIQCTTIQFYKAILFC